MRHLDLVLQNRNTTRLYAALAVKIHACLMARAAPAVADKMHAQGLRPYSMFALKQAQSIAFRFSLLHEDAMPLYESARDAKLFDVSGLDGGIAVLERVESSDVPVSELRSPIKDRVKVLFATPAAYKRADRYHNMFDLPPLLYSVADKLRLFEGVDVPNEEVDALRSCVAYNKYSLRSEQYCLKEGLEIPAFVGEMDIRCEGTTEQNSTFALLLRYAAYAGVGAKTALGMGGILVDET